LRLHRALRSFLDRVYDDMKNPGDTSKFRALNFAATNTFQVTEAFAQAVVEGRQIMSIEVVKSPICRLYSDCWDVKLKFFDPVNGQRAKRVCRLTIDVGDLMPVTVGEVRTWLTIH
jgi:PatG C-terminal